MVYFCCTSWMIYHLLLDIMLRLWQDNDLGHVFSVTFVELLKYFSKYSKYLCSPSFLSRVSIIERYHGLYRNEAIETHTCWNIGWPTSTQKSCPNFRKFCPSKSLAYEIPKKSRSSSFVTFLRCNYHYYALLQAVVWTMP